MNCDECREQVLELIEREDADPEGVREILDRCPECRAAFDETKALLALSAELPLEEPPAALDAEILQAAAARRGKVVPLRRPGFQFPRWAAAAVALLAVGVGVSAIPRDLRQETDAPSDFAADYAEPVVVGEMADAEEDEGLGEAQEPPAIAAARPAEEEAAPRRAKVERAKKKAVAPVDAPVARSAPAPASARLAQDKKAGAGASASASLESFGAEADAAESEEAPAEVRELSTVCEKKLRRFERRQRSDEDAQLAPEEALSIGECYRAAGDWRKARLWLERAADDPHTRERALRALEELPAN